MPPPFQMIMDADKTIAGSPAWTDPEGPDKKVKVVAPLMVGGRVFRGLELIGRASLSLLNSHVSFTIIYLPSDNRREAVQMARVDWRPLTPHENEHPRTPPELLGLKIVGTHHHSFALNWSAKESRPLKWLPIADEVSPDFQSFKELIDGVGSFFKISSAGSALEAPWPVDLFNR